VDIPSGTPRKPDPPSDEPSDALHNLASGCVLNYGGSYISKSDRPWTPITPKAPQIGTEGGSGIDRGYLGERNLGPGWSRRCAIKESAPCPFDNESFRRRAFSRNHQRCGSNPAVRRASRRLARIACCPSLAPVRYEHCLHSG
jgi:hypothetical protein